MNHDIFVLVPLLLMTAVYPSMGDDRKVTVPAGSADLREVSGLAAGRKNPGIVWAHNDSGDAARLFALNADGTPEAVFRLLMAANRDWEDMAAGPGPGPETAYLYIGDIGDNGHAYSSHIIYRIEEPLLGAGAGGALSRIAGDTAKLVFSYPDYAFDSECLFIDPVENAIVVVTKETGRARFFILPLLFESGSSCLAVQAADLSIGLVTGGDMTADGSALIIRTYTALYVWRRKNREPLHDLLAGKPVMTVYLEELQGEAVAWFEGGFVTMGESLLSDRNTPLIFHELSRTGE